MDLHGFIENDPVEIVDLPIENGGPFHCFLYVYQRVIHPQTHHLPAELTGPHCERRKSTGHPKRFRSRTPRGGKYCSLGRGSLGNLGIYHVYATSVVGKRNQNISCESMLYQASWVPEKGGVSHYIVRISLCELFDCQRMSIQNISNPTSWMLPQKSLEHLFLMSQG